MTETTKEIREVPVVENGILIGIMVKEMPKTTPFVTFAWKEIKRERMLLPLIILVLVCVLLGIVIDGAFLHLRLA